MATRLFRAALASAVVGLVATSAGGPAHAVPTDQSYPVPDDRVLVVRGHGYGHGHGMSQYGAYGAARQGLSHEEILDFYYPGTKMARAKGKIRVLLTADTTSDLQVAPARGLTLRDRGNGRTYSLPAIAGATRWRIEPDGDKNRVGYLTNRWHRYRPGGRAALVGEGEFFADRPLRLITPSGTKQYRGKLRAVAPTGGSAARDTVNVLSLDAYVKGVVPAEMPASWSPEAVQAQAVAARTYAARERADSSSRHYHLCDTTACQVYGGVATEHRLGNAAVRATSRQIRTYRGKPAFTQFSSSSGGWTAKGSMPYLVAQKDPYDGFSGNPVHDWTLEVRAARVEDAYPALGRLRLIRVTERDGNGQWKGRVERMVLEGSRGDVTISGDDFRFTFGLRSTWFTFARPAGTQLHGRVLPASHDGAAAPTGR